MLVASGVPQGLFLWPFFYILFVYNFPEYLTENPGFGYCDGMKIVSCKIDPLRSDIRSVESSCEKKTK